MQVTVKLLSNTAKLPEASGASTFTLFSDVNALAYVGSRMTVSTGVYIKIPENTAALILPDPSQLSLELLDSPKVLDSYSKGVISLTIRNKSANTLEIKKGTPLAQIVFVPYLPVKLTEE